MAEDTRRRVAYLLSLRAHWVREQQELKGRSPELARAIAEAIDDLDLLIFRLQDAQRRAS